MRKITPLLVLFFALSCATAHSAQSRSDKSPVLSGPQKSQLEFVESLAYLLLPPARPDQKAPDGGGPNLYGCAIVSLSDFDYCQALPPANKDKGLYCPIRVSAGFSRNSCDLEPEDSYVIKEKRPYPMAFQVRNLAGVSRVSFTLNFALATEKRPNLSRLSSDGIPWETGRVAAAVDYSQGKLYGEAGQLLASFHLSYKVDSMDDAKQTGIKACDPSLACPNGNHGGSVQVSFAGGPTVKEDFKIKSKGRALP